MTLNVGLVGFGSSARTLHTPLIRASGMHIGAVVSRNPALVQQNLPQARVLPDIESLLSLSAIDVVVIATPNDLHEPQALAALSAGKAVVIDKPMAMSVAAADRMLQADRLRRLSVFHNRRWDSDFLTVRRLIESAALGPVHTYEARWNRYRPIVADRWREHADRGGGVLLDLGSHLMDQALMLFGTPEWLQADILCRRSGAGVDDAFEIRMGRGNLRIILGADCLCAEVAPRFRLHGSLASFVKSGLDPQELQLRDAMDPTADQFGVEPQSQQGLLTWGESGERRPVVSERGAWLEFYRQLRASLECAAAPPVPALQAREGLRLLEAARLSSRTGARITL